MQIYNIRGFIQAGFTNVRFRKKIEFLNVIFHEKRSQSCPTVKLGVWRHCKLRSWSMGKPLWRFRGKNPLKNISLFMSEG